MSDSSQAHRERLVPRLRAAMRARHMSPRTEAAYAQRAVRYVKHHGMRHPLEMGEEELVAFLTCLAVLEGEERLIALVSYGSGLRLFECLQLRVKDVDLDRGELRVRRGKGDKDRITMVAESARELLVAQLERVRSVHEADLASGGGRLALPGALERRRRRRGRVISRGQGSFRPVGAVDDRKVVWPTGVTICTRAPCSG